MSETQLVDSLRRSFNAQFGRNPTGVWAAPGRVNLIGEHTDYNQGWVLPFALSQTIMAAASSRTDQQWTVHSQQLGETCSFSRAELDAPMSGWQAYAGGVVWALLNEGFAVTGADLLLFSQVPTGAGLSASAALECATLLALQDLSGLQIEPLRAAQLAQLAENSFVGAATGLMDQAASIMCVVDHAMLLDCRSLEITQIPLQSPGYEILVVNTNTPHAHVSGEYATRRATCEAAARHLGISALRDLTVESLPEALTRLPDAVMRRRVTHVVTENQRVLDASAALRAGELADLGPLLDASHRSMRDDYEITVPTVDLAVDTARQAGALGARMTGGGFGGCIIAWCRTGTAAQIAAEVETAFAAAKFAAPDWFLAAPSPGARRIA